jgi:pyruvoyl-dependent arginine decarboxylase
MFPIPKRVFLTRGTGRHRHQLTAFEHALRDADIEQRNLVTVSSILPPHCELITSSAGIAAVSPGEITFCVLARAETNEAGRWIAAGIGLAPRWRLVASSEFCASVLLASLAISSSRRRFLASSAFCASVSF